MKRMAIREVGVAMTTHELKVREIGDWAVLISGRARSSRYGMRDESDLRRGCETPASRISSSSSSSSTQMSTTRFVSFFLFFSFFLSFFPAVDV